MATRRISSIMERRRSTQTILPIISTEKRIGDKKIRFMNYVDIPYVNKLMKRFGTTQVEHMFGDVDIGILWSNSFISILLESADQVMAAMFLNNYPNVPAIPQCSWESWLVNKYNLQFMTSNNSLWVHLFLFKHEFRNEVTDAFLKFVFKKFMQIKFVFFLLPPHVFQWNWLTKFGIMINPPVSSETHCMQRLVVLRRTHFVSSYKTRRAVMQDNDDVVMLLDRTCPKLKEMYGKHYIAAIINNKDDDRQVIVAEYKGVIVAALVLNSQVNYDMLNFCFHLEIMHGLKKAESATLLTTENVKGNVYSMKSCFTQQAESNLSDFTLCTEPSTNEADEKCSKAEMDDISITSSLSICDADFGSDIELDMPSLESFESEPEVVVEKSSESMFIGHLEVNMSCVVLSYTGAEIQKFMEGKRGANVRVATMAQAKMTPFHGEPNAFAIEAIGVAKSHGFAINLLLYACYECYPDREYCLLGLPGNESTPPILNKFIRANTKRDITIPHELYLCHKLSIYGTFSVREAHQQDASGIADLVGNQRNVKILSLFTTSLLDPHTSLRSYVCLCSRNLVGFAILDEEHECDYIYSHFSSEEALPDIHGLSISHGKIIYFTILPIFEKKSRFFLEELHRLSSYSKLYYSLSATASKCIPCIISDMTLAVPIATSEFEPDGDCYWEVPKVLNECKGVSALFISTPSICARPRIEVNTRIVVVGASDVGLSFVMSLLLKGNGDKNIQYNNISIVSAHGVCKYNSWTRLIPATGNINRTTLDMHALSAYVDVVEGVMTAINRKNKTITVSNNTIFYDVLILSCGLQYQMPKRGSELRKKRTENPENVFVVNTEVDASLCLERLKKIWTERQNNVIVYGHTLNAYCCLSALLHIGLPEKFLVFVDFMPQNERMKHNQSAIFTDPAIEETILASMKKRGVRQYRGYLYTWEFDENERVKSVTFQSSRRRITLECIALFAYETKYVCQTTLHAICSAGLIFDGGLVITPDFKTNDPDIYAAGTCTKYPADYYAREKKHKYYNQVEIGRVLAKIIVGKITGITDSEDPFFRCSSDKQHIVPEYTEPLFVSCVLPEAINYLCIRKPEPMACASISSEGEVLITGDVNNIEKQGYFRLRINKYGVVDEIACISISPIENVNLTCVWGKHEILFKKMYIRYKMGQIQDFFEYFRGHEFYAIYNHMFPRLLEDITTLLLSRPDESEDNTNNKNKSITLIDDIITIFEENNGQKFQHQHFRLIKHLFSGSVYEKKIVRMVLAFLGEHRMSLPMYAHPLTIPLILSGYDDSDLFRDITPTD